MLVSDGKPVIATGLSDDAAEATVALGFRPIDLSGVGSRPRGKRDD